ncbi:hypothetical protein [Pseudomonas corrugata]
MNYATGDQGDTDRSQGLKSWDEGCGNQDRADDRLQKPGALRSLNDRDDSDDVLPRGLFEIIFADVFFAIENRKTKSPGLAFKHESFKTRELFEVTHDVAPTCASGHSVLTLTSYSGELFAHNDGLHLLN